MKYSRYPLSPGWRPPESMLQGTAIIENWEPVLDGEDLHVRGTLYGSPDPRWQDGAEIVTGVIQVLDSEHGYALGYSGSYRLGAPLRPLPEWDMGD